MDKPKRMTELKEQVNKVYQEFREAKPKDVSITKADSHVDASDISAVRAIHQLIGKPKRGKDIKCFADLPPDVQLSIDLSDIGPKEHARRVAAAIHYQHLFPDRFNSTGVGV